MKQTRNAKQLCLPVADKMLKEAMTKQGRVHSFSCSTLTEADRMPPQEGEM